MHKIDSSDSTSPTGQTLSEQAFLRLRRDVISCDHAPGVKLKVEDLQEAYGYSSSPLREALNRLSQEGLVKADDRRGFRVALITAEDLADLTHMRLMVEVPALRLAIECGDDAWEAAVVAAASTKLQIGEIRTPLKPAPQRVFLLPEQSATVRLNTLKAGKSGGTLGGT